MWNIAYTVTSVGFVLGLSLCARILHITLSDNRHHLLGKPFREWPLQLKIRMCSIVSVLVIEFTYVAEFLGMVCWGVLPSIAEGLVVGVFTTMLFTCLTFATVERFRTFLMAAKKSKLEKWLHWIVYSECISGLLMNFTGAAANWVTISSPEDERVSALLWLISLIFKLYFILVLILLDIVCNWKMICFFIANQIDLEAHSSDNDAQAQKMSFKAKMLRLFILLVTIDLLALIINFVFELVPSLYTPDIQIAVFAWTADFIYPFHILVMFTLLSMFKEEVLRKKQAKNITISKTSIGGVGHERDQKEVVSDDGSKIQSTAG